MTPRKIYAYIFSPTGTSRRIARAATQGIALRAGALPTEALPTASVDLTHAEATATPFSATDVVLFAVPVYGGKVAPTALQRMEQLRGANTPAVLIVVYGNRDIGNAATQLAEVVSARGFIPIAAAAFVGEHSYANANYPIATARPDAQDLARATAFGAAIRQKLAADQLAAIPVAQLKAPRTPLLAQLRFLVFVLNYMRRQRKHPLVYLPECNSAQCTHCGKCIALCPVQAITQGDESHTDAARCIRCCACVKGCPVQARSFASPFAKSLSRNFARRKEPVTLL